MTDSRPAERLSNDCFRCGYALRGIADDQPCPECGLLAQRSRRETDELHLARPIWLRRLARGVWLILLAFAWPIVWMVAWQWMARLVLRQVIAGSGALQNAFFYSTGGGSPFGAGAPLWAAILIYLDRNPQAGLLVSTLMLICGAWLISRREGFEPADRADALRRRWLLICSMVPTIGIVSGVALQRPVTLYWPAAPPSAVLPILIATIGSVPLAILLFFQLRSLARRARSANLAEHCAIVGFGVAGSLIVTVLLYLAAEYPAEIGLGTDWSTHGSASLMLIATVLTIALLFYSWGGLLMIRFSLAFWRAARQLRKDWKRDDRAVDV